ncbi:hypothetical protein LX36DRAFT_460946 [Colletotrichum falcatum]|nr:hypothetical protein LX36DRAFT_460946 [Colletotrichum falcatum]
MRSYYSYNRPIRRGGWQSIAWNFLLEVILVNSFLLQRWGTPSWRSLKKQQEWRQVLSDQLIQQFGPSLQLRKRLRPLRRTTTTIGSIIWEHHRKGSRGVCSPCSYCGRRKSQPLCEASGNTLNQRKRTRQGCLDCDVPLCTKGDCWYLWHSQNI